jgi:hypothetical protein
MLFATTTAAARIEHAEADTAREFGLRARAQGADVLIFEIGGTVAVFGGSGQPFNKLAGLGFESPVSAESLVALEAAYDARGGEVRVEQATLADPSVATLLTRRGYELVGYENVLGLALDAETRHALAVARDEDRSREPRLKRPARGSTRSLKGFCIRTHSTGRPRPSRSRARSSNRYSSASARRRGRRCTWRVTTASLRAADRCASRARSHSSPARPPSHPIVGAACSRRCCAHG